MTNYHFVQHFLRDSDSVQTEFSCTAPEGAPCRMFCKTCMDEQLEACQCEYDDFRTPNMVDMGSCNYLNWLEDAPEEVYNGNRQPVRGPDPQPITLEWTGDYFCWDYSS